MRANWRSTNTPNVVYINTDLHRATLLDEDVSYPIDAELGQGRNCKTPVPAFSMMAGKPVAAPKLNKAALLFWSGYWAVLGLSVTAAILAIWPRG
jgi:hypothetical protein